MGYEIDMDIFEKVYPDSYKRLGAVTVFMAVCEKEKVLAAYTENGGDDALYHRLEGAERGDGARIIKICPLRHENARTVREFFPFTAPVSHSGKNITIGFGDRLGLASPGHIRLIKDLGVFPVLAQQSIRELNLTGRTYDDVLDAATWAVLQEGYEKGFGADGDHLKTAGEVRMALGCGFTMITLDCSEQIKNSAISAPPDEIDALYGAIPERERAGYEADYLGKTFEIGGGVAISFSADALKRIAVIYSDAISHAARIYNDIIINCGRAVDFEMSVDETQSETSPEAHFFVASELVKNGVVSVSLAPRFCGEFQKGIDYVGDLAAFERDFTVHARIAEHFGYKLSVHSGSDKFAVFKTVGEKTGGKYHLKTAGTNWLEALRVIARKDPELFRDMVDLALKSLPDAKKYYHITENVANIPDAGSLPDDRLTELLENSDSRQVLHVTYGFTLAEYKKRIYELLNRFEDDYCEALIIHIGKHLNKLGII